MTSESIFYLRQLRAQLQERVNDCSRELRAHNHSETRAWQYEAEHFISAIDEVLNFVKISQDISL